MAQIGIEFEVVRFAINESPQSNESAESYVSRMSHEKAQVGLRITASAAINADWPVLAADTIVVSNGEILGKPESQQQGIEMLSKLSNATHRVLTAVALASGGGKIETICVATDVMFREITPSEMNAYWHSGEPQDKAGGYGIQGLGAVFVSRIEGSYSNVVGLPLQETAKLLESVQIRCL